MTQDSKSEVMFSLSNKKIVMKHFLYLKMVIYTSYYMYIDIVPEYIDIVHKYFIQRWKSVTGITPNFRPGLPQNYWRNKNKKFEE